MKKLVLFLFLISLIAAGCDNPQQTTQQSATQPVPQQQSVVQPPPVASIESQRQCASDGKTFADGWFKKMVPSVDSRFNNINTSYTTNDPIYHFSTKLNTCLVYVGYSVNVSSPTNVISNWGYSHFDVIFDIYSNAAILDSSTYRICEPSKPCTETANPGIYNAKTISSTDFFAQRDVLFSQ